MLSHSLYSQQLEKVLLYLFSVKEGYMGGV